MLKFENHEPKPQLRNYWGCLFLRTPAPISEKFSCKEWSGHVPSSALLTILVCWWEAFSQGTLLDSNFLLGSGNSHKVAHWFWASFISWLRGATSWATSREWGVSEPRAETGAQREYTRTGKTESTRSANWWSCPPQRGPGLVLHFLAKAVTIKCWTVLSLRFLVWTDDSKTRGRDSEKGLAGTFILSLKEKKRR